MESTQATLPSAKDVSMLSCNGNVLVGKLAELLVS